MILSEDRQSHLAHVIVDGIWEDDLVDYSDDDLALRMAKKAIIAFVQEMGDLDATVKQKLQALKRGVVEGSPEWDILYRKYMNEELNKRGK
ncbi:MAG: hypothetical protein A4S09_05840 [Proteobacteria bacterium SG_bin7]|nr:MAG: hypothetical protein A4S09_05840 [Proteobacteria bacterium SG_bin7]